MVSVVEELLGGDLSPDEREELEEVTSDPMSKAVVVLRAFGIPPEVVQAVLGFTPARQSSLLATPILSDLYEEWALKVNVLMGDAAVDRLVPMALLVQQSILSDTRAKTEHRMKVSTEVLDRSKGKPKQSVDIRSLSLALGSGDQKALDNQIESVQNIIKKLEATVNAQRNS